MSEDKLGTYISGKAKLPRKEDSQARFLKARPMPCALKPKVEEELQYLLPRIEDIFANLAGGQKFSKIDLREAYHQLEMKEDSKKYININTHMGCFSTTN